MPKTFKDLLALPRPLIAPIAHDAMTARMVADAGFDAVGLAGSSILAAQYAWPDVGLAGLGEMAEGARQVLRGHDLPWGMDADDGFGDVRNVVLTVRTFDALGCGQLIFEDQLRASKKPGDGGSQQLVTIDEMSAKVRAACETRDDPGAMMIIGRTDAFLLDGMDAALRRADAYLKAGADGVFIAGLQTVEDLRIVGDRFRHANPVAVVGERKIRLWPGPAELYDLGFNQISYPNLLLLRAVGAVQSGLSDLAGLISGSVAPQHMPNFEMQADDLARHLRLDEWNAIGGAR